MKRFFLIALSALSLVSCAMVTPMQSRITACPFQGLSDVAFFLGTPSSGVAVFPDALDDGGNEWDFKGNDGDVYLVCKYADGDEKLQLLPASFSSCSAQRDGDRITDLSCKASL